MNLNVFVCLVFQDEVFLRELRDELAADNESSTQVVHLIVKAMSRIMDLQRLSAEKESKRNFVRRGLEKGVVLDRDVDVQKVVTKLLSNPYGDRDGVLRFQDSIYKEMMQLESKALEGEMVELNRLGSQQRRFLKAIATESVFKICVDFLTVERAACINRCGRQNEVVWKAALIEKEARDKSVNAWARLTANLKGACKDDDLFKAGKSSAISCLSFSNGGTVDIPPTGENDARSSSTFAEAPPQCSSRRLSDVSDRRDSRRLSDVPDEVENDYSGNDWFQFTP